ncbi:MAG: hypothetical protein KKE86_00345 [Planctomycetes bacterium]|nr:hypothetical protein [Planctomycetota bacterium]MBU4397759.1 hypothetical protein [Planctomycetota bacterium]MCG2682581.1 hypothetical protein [Planctomycetales bacterium]
MARENQGLQITLIVFVMLTIVLGVMTYLFYRRYEEAAIKAKTNANEASREAQLASKNEDDANELKRLIGVAPTEKVDDITTLSKEDMKKYGQSYPEEARYYRLLLEKMQKTIEEKNAELSDAKNDIRRRDDLYAVREKNTDPKIKQFQDASVKASQDLTDERSKFKGEVERKNEEGTRLHENLQNSRKDAAEQIAKVEAKLQKTDSLASKRGTIIDDLTIKIESFEKGKIDAPDGEVLWTNQREGTVWINLGRADTLKRQVTFSVYPSDNTNLTVSDKKGSIEITHILGEHLAEARVLDDQIGDPIVPGDKIHTVLWSAGKKRHFALAGLIDIDGDGRSDLDMVINIIRLNGGEIDCYISDKGENKNEMVGKITVNTNALIQGEAPTEKGDPAQLAAFTKIQTDADILRTPKMQLGDLLQRMGWKNLSPVVRYGRGANPNDFRAKPDDGVPRKSTGNVSDLYQKRNPPKRAPSGGMYHRF